VQVVFLTSNYPPEAHGGTEQVVSALARSLCGAGVGVTVLTASDRVHFGVDRQDALHEGVPVQRFFKHHGEWDRDGFHRPRLVGLVRESLRTLQPDVVHVHSFAALGTGCLAACHELGIPVVFTAHDLWVTCARYFRLPPAGVVCPVGADRGACAVCLDRDLQLGPPAVLGLLAQRDAAVRAEVALAAAVTAPSHAAAQFVRECLPYAGPIHVVPHGLLRPVPVAARSPAPQPGEVLRIGTFGNLVAEKGVRELVAAAAGLPCELHLAGRFLDPGFAAAVRDLARTQGTVLVEHGPFGPDDPHPARFLHLAVFPSKCQETYGLVVDEALAHGVPAVLSTGGAFADRRGQPGLLVAPLPELPMVLARLLRQSAELAALRAAVPIELPTIAASAAFHLDLYRRLA
jgi:glycosyltransferase involved in cell wall biosynthesis